MEKTVPIPLDAAPILFGAFDENMRLAEELLSVHIAASPVGVALRGEEAAVARCVKLIEKLCELIGYGEKIDKQRVRRVFDMVEAGAADEIVKLARDAVAVTARGRQIKCKTLGQRTYTDAIKAHPLTFGIGPAGTGKTYLAVALAVTAYKRSEVERIVLTRPAIEAGERLGFLPGDLQAKVDPYLRPLYDALGEMLGVESYNRLLERGIIEIAPLAYMRGRTLSRACIILDEAQNTTVEQMKMFLTRMGEGSKIIVTGDPTQVDLPEGKISGLKHAVRILENVPGIAVCRLTEKDVVRHELVQRIILAYESKNKGAQTDKR